MARDGGEKSHSTTPGLLIELVPLTRAKANAYVLKHHRHNDPVRSDFFRVGAAVNGALVAVCIAATPNAPEFQKVPTIAEVTRLCTDRTKNVGTKLLGAIRSAALALGYRRLVSYTRIDEPGTVYRAAGWWPTAKVPKKRRDTGNRRARYLPGMMPATKAEEIAHVRWETGPDAAPELSELAHLGRRKGAANAA